ncbi:hypothetical protein HUJ05_007498 [Dendroctonus ponderosae]|nr:hypothetical protein HUJ05_007498 [Dendroctonus ponderosae]
MDKERELLIHVSSDACVEQHRSRRLDVHPAGNFDFLVSLRDLAGVPRLGRFLSRKTKKLLIIVDLYNSEFSYWSENPADESEWVRIRFGGCLRFAHLDLHRTFCRKLHCSRNKALPLKVIRHLWGNWVKNNPNTCLPAFSARGRSDNALENSDSKAPFKSRLMLLKWAFKEHRCLPGLFFMSQK